MGVVNVSVNEWAGSVMAEPKSTRNFFLFLKNKQDLLNVFYIHPYFVASTKIIFMLLHFVEPFINFTFVVFM